LTRSPGAPVLSALEASSRVADRAAIVLAALFFCALALYGARVHWLEEAGTAERDGYVHQAEVLRAGGLPRDPFRPLFYPLLIAAVTPVAGSAFAAARLLSNLAAAGLLLLAYGFGRQLVGPAAGLWAMALLAVNPNLWIIGQHVTTDMVFAALAASALYFGLEYLLEANLRSALLAGLFVGLAAFTRSNAVFVVPPLAVAWWCATGPRRPRVAHLVAGVASAVLVLLPHWWLRAAEFGDPFYDENWKNLAFKLHGYPDWSYLGRVPYSGLLAIVRSEPGAIASGAVRELWRFTMAGLPQLVGTWLNVALLAVGIVVVVTRRAADERIRWGGLWSVGSLALFVLATATTFFTWGRFLLIVLPGASALSAAALAMPPRRAGPAFRRIAVGAGVVVIAVLALKTFRFRLPVFAADHPYREVEVLRQMESSLPGPTVLAGTSPFLGRYLHHRYVDLPDAFGSEIQHPELYYRRLDALLRREDVAYVVVGTIDLRDRPEALISGSQAIPGLALVRREEGIAVWKVNLDGTRSHARALPG
jgi:hypothetical protein